MKRSITFAVVLLVSLLGGTFATTYEALTLDEILAKTEIGFYGQVSEVSVEERDGDPWTLVTFEILEALIGVTPPEDSNQPLAVTLAFYGGTLPSGESLLVSLMPQFSVGETVLVLAYNEELYSPIVGFRQGLWRSTTLGLRDESGRLLSLGEAGTVALDGVGADTDALLNELRDLLEAR